MNYQHDFHAGNFADVFKHVILACILSRLCAKPAAFCYIDTHAGSGLYRLLPAAAGNPAEREGGIGKILAARPAPEVEAIAAPYLRIALPLAGGCPPKYPGSPLVAKALLRAQDRMLLCELEPQAFSRPGSSIGADRRAKLLTMDGYMGLRAFVPPPGRRGLVLVDPPYEEEPEWEKANEAVAGAWRKWATGIHALWYPVKDKRAAAAIARILARHGIARALCLELQIDPPLAEGKLARCGLVIINPPFQLDEQARILLPRLASSLGKSAPGFSASWPGGAKVRLHKRGAAPTS